MTIPYRANLLGNIEQALKGLQGYGIMALELIQNADDAGAGTLRFDVTDDALVVFNDGSFSSCGLQDADCPWIRSGDPDGLKRPCNFHAIAEMGSRSKVPASEQIGRFGIGFVSVYQITDTPIVQSAGVELRLNPQTQEVVKTNIAKVAGTRFILPWASVQSEVRDGLNASPTPVDVAERVVAEIEIILQGSLLFLRHVSRVELMRNGDLVAAVGIHRAAEQVTLRFEPAKTEQRWLVLSRDADDIILAGGLIDRFEALTRLDRSTTVSVAVPLNLEQVEGLLYAYLPTRQSTRMPFHLNADFFPHASRQAIVLEGEQHDRYWNEALMEAAAVALADNFVRIRDLLGPTRFWALAEATFQRKSEPAFKPFWDKLGKAAAATPSIWSTQGEWRLPAETSLPPEQMIVVDQAAVSDLGLALIHPELRRHWTVLSSLGAQHLRLSNLVAALEAHGNEATSGGMDALRRLWSAIDLLIEVSSDRTGLAATIARLKAVPVFLDLDDRAVSASSARRLPAGVPVASLHEVVPARRVVHPEVLRFPQLSLLVQEYLLDDFAADLAGMIANEAAAAIVIGETEAEVRRFYALLTAFPTDRGATLVRTRLSHVPMLRTGTGYVSPARGRLPGDFRDPIGHFEIVETRLFITGMGELTRKVLQVDELSFREYVVEHLASIIAQGVTRQQYGALLTEIVNHRSQLDDEGALSNLAKIAFVRTRAGAYAPPDGVYFWSAAIESILGNDPALWVDETWLPPEILSRAKDVFERLGMGFSVAPEHIVDRISAIAEGSGLDAIVSGTVPIVRHVLERWTRYDDEDRLVLGRLKDVKFLSAIVDGERKEGLRYSPRGVYRAGRATGFSSQVPVVEMTALRLANAVVGEFLDLIEMPAEPATEKIVAHLEHCMATNTPVNDLTYQMLNERLERGVDAASIDRLAGTDFIHVLDVGFIGAGSVFWVPPVFGGRWHTASPRMRQREQLYRRLGVVDSPEPRHFVALALQIAATQSRSSSDVYIHERCLAALAEALEREDAGAADAVKQLEGKAAFLNVDDDATWTGDAIWLDSEQLAASFGSALNNRLVRLPDVGRSAALRLLNRLDVPALSDVARFSLAEEPDGRGAEEATDLLLSRADLILWLAPNLATRRALRSILQRLEVRFSDRLMVQAEIDAFDPPVRSPASSATAFLDGDAGVLHIRSTTGRPDWAAAFRALFAEVERHCPAADIPPLCLTAAYIMSLHEREEAEHALRASDFKAPGDDGYEVEAGRELVDELEDDVAEPRDNGSEGFVHRDVADAEEVDDASAGDRDPQQDQDEDDDTGFDDDVGHDETIASRTVAAQEDAPPASEAGDDVDEAGPDDDDAGFEDEHYGSASSRGAFGMDAAVPGNEADKTPPTEQGGPGGNGSPRSRGASFRTGGNPTAQRDGERQVRRSRMLSYVSRTGTRGDGDGPGPSADGDITGLIDEAAMKAAMAYEKSRGWEPERQPHFNPGFDIVSRSPVGERRLIEVKGLENEWTERGIKLSHVQFSMAHEHPDDFWIYVVEHARDLESQRVTAIGNPFGKVEEYWFDHNWRDTSEERAASRDILLKVGLKVAHRLWGSGVVVEIKSRGVIPFVVVDFGSIEGRRGVPFNSSLRIKG